MRSTLAVAAIFASALAAVPHVSLAQTNRPNPQGHRQSDIDQIERVAMRAVHASLAARGVTGWDSVGFDPDLDAHLRPLVNKRSSAHAQDLANDLGATRISREAIRATPGDCRSGSTTKLVYLGRPTIQGDSAMVPVLFELASFKVSCRFFMESKTLTFARRGGSWVYVGVRGPTVQT